MKLKNKNTVNSDKKEQLLSLEKLFADKLNHAKNKKEIAYIRCVLRLLFLLLKDKQLNYNNIKVTLGEEDDYVPLYLFLKALKTIGKS